MKKILSILMILVLVGGVAFAQVEPEVRGSATLSWGIDFGAGSETDYTKGGADNHAVATHGFYNTNNFQVRLPFFKRQDFAGGSASKEADVYADVSFKATPVATGWTESGKAVSVKAILHFYGAYMTVYGKPDFKANKALGWDPINADDGDQGKGWFNPAFTGWGTKIGYKKADLMGLDVGLKLGSNGSWHQKASDGEKDGKRREKDSKYAFGLDFPMQPVEKYLGVEATLNATLGKFFNRTPLEGPGDYGYNAGNSPNNIGGKDRKSGMVNFGVAFKSEPIEEMTVKLGFDGVTGVTYTDNKGKLQETLGWDAGLSVGYKWVDAGLYLCGTGTTYQGYDLAGNDPTKWKDYGANMAAHLGFVSDEEAKKGTGFVDGLAFHVTINAYDLLGKRNKEDIPEAMRKANFALANAYDSLKKIYDVALAAWLKANPGQTEADYQATNPIEYTNLQASETAQKAVNALRRTKYGSLPLGLNLGVSYKHNLTDSMWIKPYAEFYAETNHYKQHGDTYASDPDKAIDKLYLGMAYKLGVEFQPIEKVLVTAAWNQGKVDADTYEGGFTNQYMIKTPLNHKMHNGTFVLSLKLIY